ncbi:MAG: hypothetical protein A2V67_04115 [Deltaproteobacteria bacterium RBG_13_61_14]|nr:MAG: hypothetical protein A2V67_04115 [Deltaproteobacteria bacterium RBG_13_61_14]
MAGSVSAISSDLDASGLFWIQVSLIAFILAWGDSLNLGRDPRPLRDPEALFYPKLKFRLKWPQKAILVPVDDQVLYPRVGHYTRAGGESCAMVIVEALLPNGRPGTGNALKMTIVFSCWG